MGAFNSFMDRNSKMLTSTRFAVFADDIAKALVQSVVVADATGQAQRKLNEVLENEDIKARAMEYNAAVGEGR